MGEGGSTERLKRPRSRAGIFVLRLVSGLVAVAALAALTSDLADKASAPGARTAPAPEVPDDIDDDEPGSRRGKPKVVHFGDPTVYDTLRDLEECVRARRPIGPSSRGPGLDDDIARVSARVERLRRLQFRRPVAPRLVSRAEVGERFVRGYLRRYSPREAQRDEQVLTALGLLPEGTDLRALTAQLLSEGVAGFYNPRNGRMFAASTGGVLSPMDEVVLAHELDHALVDQALGLPGTLSHAPMLGDVMLAHQVLAEGDATLLMSKYAARRFPSEELDGFMARFEQRTVQAPTPIPYFIARASEFPYSEGLLFACGAAGVRGWDAVNEMYRRPPASTADVLFPERYLDGNEAELPRSPSAPGPSWGPLRARSFGAFDLMVLLENADLQSQGETIPGSHVDAVRGWDGGVLNTWLRGDQTTIHIGLVDAGVKARDGRRRSLCGVLRRWVLESFPAASPARARVPGAEAWRSEGDLALLRCAGPAVELAKGPSARAVRAVFGG